MKTNFQTLCEELVQIADALVGATPTVANQGQPLDGFSALANFTGLADRARAALAEPVGEVAMPHWSEGICGDGAAILRDGEMVPIEEVVAELNRGARARAARAAKADRPAVPEGREPASVVGEPSDEELLELSQFHCVSITLNNGSAVSPFVEGTDIRSEVLSFARAVLSRYGHQPAPAAEGVDRSHISDGYHTFAELYDHRHSLMLALMRAIPKFCWFSQRHADGEMPFGTTEWFIAGVDLPAGAITYHLPSELLSLAQQTGAAELSVGRPWDGHTANDVIERLRAWVASPQPALSAEGEVGELVAWLRNMANAGLGGLDELNAACAADLLERQAAPVPVAVSERLPEPEDCDAEHYCWRWNTIGGLWARQPLARSWYEFESHWLPANALPLPQGEVEP